MAPVTPAAKLRKLERNRRWKAANRDRVREYSRNYYRRNMEDVRSRRDEKIFNRMLKDKYGLTPDQLTKNTQPSTGDTST